MQNAKDLRARGRSARAFKYAAWGLALVAPVFAAQACGDDKPGTQTSSSTRGSGGGETASSSSVSSGGGEGGSGGMGTPGSSTGAGGAGGAGGADAVAVQILAFNDFHGNLQPPAGSGGKITLPDMTQVFAGGAAHFAAHMATLKAQNPNTVVVSAGDLIGATPLVSALFHDEPTIEAMNMIGLDINGVGNHEFDEGSSELLRMQYGGCHPADGCADGTFYGGANFSFLSANVVVNEATGKTLFPGYEIRDLGGVRVGFIGLTLEGTPSIVTPLGVAGLAFKDEVETINKAADELKGLGVETIVVLLHEGGLPMGFYNECPGISGPVVDIAMNTTDAVDVIASGHTHQAYNCTIGDKLVTSAASAGRIITQIDLSVSPVTGDVVAKTAKNVIVTRDVVDADIETFVSDYVALSAPLANKPLGKITTTLSKTAPPNGSGLSPMGVVVANSQLAATADPKLGGAQIAFMNPGGVRADMVYDDNGTPADPSDDGTVTYGDAFAVQPFGNNLVVMTLTGAQVKTLLEQQFYLGPNGNALANILQVSQGFTYTYSLSAPIGAKVDPASMMLNGVVIDPAQPYRVVVNSFLASGGDAFSVLPSGTERLGGVVDLEAMQAYFSASSPISPPPVDAITVVP